MAEIRISDAPVVTGGLKNSDKLPISIGDNQAHSVSLELLKGFCAGLTRVSWNDVEDKPLIPIKTSDLVNDNQFQSAEEVNKTIDLKGFITKKEAKNSFVAVPKVNEVKAEAVTELILEPNSKYMIDCGSGVAEKIEIMNFVADLNSVCIFIKRISKPVQLVFPKSAVFLTQRQDILQPQDECMIEINLNYVRLFGTGNAIM